MYGLLSEYKLSMNILFHDISSSVAFGKYMYMYRCIEKPSMGNDVKKI